MTEPRARAFAAKVRYRTGEVETVISIPEGRDPFEVMEAARARLFPEVTAEQIAAQSRRADEIIARRGGEGVKATQTRSGDGVKPTSVEAYGRLRSEGRLTKQHTLILSAWKPGVTYTRQELVKLTGLGINAICGRVAELVGMGAVQVSGKRACTVTGSNVEALAVSMRRAA